jgi:beta-lactamase superfamily II metal-dependent hydrolase
MSSKLLACLLCLAALPACSVAEDGPADEEETVELDDKGDGLPRSVTIRRVWSQNQLPIPVQSGAYQIHNIDVGTGLAVLVRGSSFTMLFDGGSADDKASIASDGRRNPNRLIAYLFGALGPSGPSSCTPEGDHFARLERPRLRIDHLVLSHAHDDHVSLLPDVIKCYDVDNVWEPGAVATTAIYDKFVRAVAAQPGIAYHTAAAPTADRTIALKSGPLTFGPNVAWTRFVDYAALSPARRRSASRSRAITVTKLPVASFRTTNELRR